MGIAHLSCYQCLPACFADTRHPITFGDSRAPESACFFVSGSPQIPQSLCVEATVSKLQQQQEPW